jgi:hypothetical protein
MVEEQWTPEEVALISKRTIKWRICGVCHDVTTQMVICQWCQYRMEKDELIDRLRSFWTMHSRN